MKTIKLLFLFLAVSSAAFYSCSDDNPIENHADAESSIALRTMLAEYKKVHGIAGRSASDAIFCFEFVYPITFTYNTGTAITVTSLDGLLDILSNESPQFYLDGVVFPFQVIQQMPAGSAENTINSESEFVALLESCGIDIINDDLQNSFCFDIVFPITVTNSSGENVVIANITGFESYLSSLDPTSQPSIVFPISVLFGGQVVNVTNIYEFYQIIDNCDECICTQEYFPVCVQTANGVMQFGNSCYAICAGYTQNDFVSCNSAECNINDLTVTVGNCNPDTSYALTIDFTGANPASSQFEVYNSTNGLVGTYNLADLPITINYTSITNATDFLVVKIVGSNCTATQNWILPDCDCTCPANADPVCVMTPTGPIQFINECLANCAGYTSADFIECGIAPNTFAQNLGSCFTISYPVHIQHQGALVTVNSDGQLLQYYFPAVSAVPAFNYPIMTSFNGIELMINSQSEFESAMENICN